LTPENAPSSVISPEGRRVLVAVVTGEPGARIQRWRETHDPGQASRIPPHTTLCYWVPEVPLADLKSQVIHAFRRPVRVRLGAVEEFDNEQHTFYVAVSDSAELDAARRRLYDGRYVALAGFREWTWHVTCVRESIGRDLLPLRAAARDLSLHSDWHIDTVACLELQDARYVALAEWSVG
jgi:hypothetical protein